MKRDKADLTLSALGVVLGALAAACLTPAVRRRLTGRLERLRAARRDVH